VHAVALHAGWHVLPSGVLLHMASTAALVLSLLQVVSVPSAPRLWVRGCRRVSLQQGKAG